MPRSIRLAISTCPNDTFAFHALINRLVDWRGLEFEIELLDIQQLNERLLKGSLDIAKTSFHAALLLAQNYSVFDSGSALGFGVGPLLLASQPGAEPSHDSQVTLCPGEHTTASLLFKLFYPNTTKVQQVVFSEVMPRLKDASADFGVCIHEGRFTWESEGLHLVADLGSLWEGEMKAPLPLGGIVGAKSLGDEVLSRVQKTIYESIQYAHRHPKEPLPTMRKYAQEFDDDVLVRHVDLYVNQWTTSLGEEGSRALDLLAKKANEVGLTQSAISLDIIR